MALVGRPNVGKSSLFNALLAENRSIVTEIPGTTRDLVAEFTNIGGIPVRLQDTAGIHNSAGSIEKMGIDRSLQAIADGDAIVLVVDTSLPITQEDLDLNERLTSFRCVVAMNKSDLVSRWSAKEKVGFAGGRPWAEVSAKTAMGIEQLRSMILDQTLGSSGPGSEGILVTNLRHCRNMQAAEKDLGCAAAALRDGLSEEFALLDLRGALQKLGEITGETGVEDLLGEIFSHFCVGK
jgi:tRNA modification GTPase